MVGQMRIPGIVCYLLCFLLSNKFLNSFIIYFSDTIASAIQRFKKHNLDAIFLVTNAPGRSAFNRVERRMAPLSAHLSGVLLNHDTFDNHLNNQGKTVDTDLEKKNFEAAGRTLADIWNKIVLDKHPVVAEYITPSKNPELKLDTDHEWYMNHVQESQYFTQVFKSIS